MKKSSFGKHTLTAALALALFGTVSFLGPGHRVFQAVNGPAAWTQLFPTARPGGSRTTIRPWSASRPMIRWFLPIDKIAQRDVIGRWSANGDDGNLNYRDSGDLISHAVKATVELDVQWRNYGGFARATAFYDFENHNKDGLSDIAQKRVGKEARLLDAYVYGNHDPGGHFLTWRLGKQVVSWGESTFIQGGINVINPVDVSKLRVAGAELKEAFEGVNMLYGSV